MNRTSGSVVGRKGAGGIGRSRLLFIVACLVAAGSASALALPKPVTVTRGDITLSIDASSGLWSCVAGDLGPLLTEGALYEGERRLEPVGALAQDGADGDVSLILHYQDPRLDFRMTLTAREPVLVMEAEPPAGVRVHARVRLGEEPRLGRLEHQSLKQVFGVASGPVNSLNARTLFDHVRNVAVALDGEGRFVHPAGAPPDAYAVESGAFPVRLTLHRQVVRGDNFAYYAPIDRSVFTHAPGGWCSWYYYYQGIDEKAWAANAAWMGRHLGPYGAEFVQLDDGWQRYNGRTDTPGGRDWRGANDKFPSGMKAAAEVVKANGLKPGLWLIPQKHDVDALFEAHPEYHLRREDGSPIRIPDWSPHNTGQYLIDFTHPGAVADYYAPLWKTMADDWGFAYFKIDNQPEMAAWYGDPDHRRRDMKPSGDEVYRRSLTAIREIIGPERFLLGCYGIPLKGMGIMNGSRTGGDMYASWDGVQVLIDMIPRWNFLNNTAWWCDPDTLCVREPLTLDEARLVTTLLSLSGQVLMVSDKMDELPAERVEVLRRAFPTVDIRPMEFHYWSEPRRPPVVNLKVAREFGEWDVAAVFNYGNESRRHTLAFADLGLPTSPALRYQVYDFWQQEYLGAFSESVDLTVPPHGCRLLSIHAEQDRPQILSTSRHITQGAMDLINVVWNPKDLTLSGQSRLVGGDPYTLVISTPRSPLRYQVAGCVAGGGPTRHGGLPIEIVPDGAVTRVTFRSHMNRDADWVISFNTTPATDRARAPRAPRAGGDANPAVLVMPDAGADHYRVYRDGRHEGDAWTAAWTGSLLPPGTRAEYRIAAVDAAGNESAHSLPLDWTAPAKMDMNAVVRAVEATSGAADIGVVDRRFVVPPGETITRRIPLGVNDRYRLEVAAVAWDGMGRLTVRDGQSVLVQSHALAASEPEPRLGWLSIGEVAGEEITLAFTAEGGPVALLNLRAEPMLVLTEARAAGTWENTGGKGFQAVYPPEPAADGGADVVWRGVRAGEQAIFDLAAIFDEREHVVAYLRAEVEAEKETRATLLIGSDDGVKVWVNGALVHAHDISRGLKADEDRAEADFRKGRNAILIKITQGGGGWEARLRIADPHGLLRFAPLD